MALYFGCLVSGSKNQKLTAKSNKYYILAAKYTLRGVYARGSKIHNIQGVSKGILLAYVDADFAGRTWMRLASCNPQCILSSRRFS